MKSLYKSFFQVILLLLITGSALAQTISIQGVLREPNGRSVDDGAYNVTFKLYEESTGGTALWSETYSDLPVKHGVFQANLGTNASLNTVSFDTTYFVGVTVEDYAEMSPRIQLTIYPYAKSILGQDNKFPASGNIVLAKDSIIVKQGALKFEGADGRIVFNDGTSLNTAAFGGPAASLLNPSSVNINADSDSDNTGAINFQTRGVTRASISNDGNATFNGGLGAANAITSGTYNAGLGILSLYGPDASSASGGQLNLFTSDTRATEKWFFQPNENNLLIGHETGGAFPTVATFSSTKVDFENDIVAKGNISSKQGLFVGEDDSVAGFINLYGSAPGSSQGGRVNFFKAADHDSNDGLQEHWFMEAINDDLRIGNIFVNNDVMSFRNDGNIGIGGASDPQIDFAIGDHDTGLNWVSDGAFNLMSNGTQALSVGNNGQIGIGDNTPTEARLVINGSPSTSHNVTYAYTSIQNLGGAPYDWDAVQPPGFFSTYSVWADGHYGGIGFLVFSDERIKDIIGLSDNASDLEILKKFNITNYSFIDKVRNGNKIEKKVIAQEVAEVYPQAITTSTSVVPNIYEVPKKIEYSNGLLTIKLNKSHSLTTGDKVQCFIEDETVFLNVDDVVSDDSFTAVFNREPTSIFIYGQEVDDFHTVDYDAISMLNVSATQELAKRTEDQEKRIAELEAENARLKKEVERIDKLEAKLDVLLRLEEKQTKASLIGQE